MASSAPNGALAGLVLTATLAWTARAGAESAPSGESDTELTVVPVVGGSSDVGLGGYIASFALLEPNLEPSRYSFGLGWPRDANPVAGYLKSGHAF